MANLKAAARKAQRLREEKEAAEREVLLTVGEVVRDVYERPATKASRAWANLTVAQFAAEAFGGGAHGQNGAAKSARDADAEPHFSDSNDAAEPGQFDAHREVI